MQMTEEEMQNYFPTVYPKMFSGRYGGIAVGKGWFGILTQLCQSIQSHIDWRVTQREQAIKYNTMAQAGKDGNADLFGDLAAAEYANNPFFTKEYIKERCEEMMKNPLRKVPDECSQVIVEQVKEKFGSLRFYYQGGDEYIHGLVSMAESMSGITCEECGAPGETGGNGWISTLCETHRAARDAARDASRKRADQEWEHRKLLKEGFEE
jgi:hypothetical protein